MTLSEDAFDPGVSSRMDWDFYAIPIVAILLTSVIVYMRFLGH